MSKTAALKVLISRRPVQFQSLNTRTKYPPALWVLTMKRWTSPCIQTRLTCFCNRSTSVRRTPKPLISNHPALEEIHQSTVLHLHPRHHPQQWALLTQSMIMFLQFQNGQHMVWDWITALWGTTPLVTGNTLYNPLVWMILL
jgi:hypothetical protein